MVIKYIKSCIKKPILCENKIQVDLINEVSKNNFLSIQVIVKKNHLSLERKFMNNNKK